MAFTRSSTRTTGNGITGPRTTQSARVKPSLMGRLTGRKKIETTTVTRETHTVPKHGHHTTSHHTTPHHTTNHRTAGTTTMGATHHQKRHATMGDKLSGAMLKMKGSVDNRPGEKAVGVRRMHGTDGRGSRRVY